MRTKLIVLFSVLAGALLAWNLHTILLKVPDEASQGRYFGFSISTSRRL